MWSPRRGSRILISPPPSLNVTVLPAATHTHTKYTYVCIPLWRTRPFARFCFPRTELRVCACVSERLSPVLLRGADGGARGRYVLSGASCCGGGPALGTHCQSADSTGPHPARHTLAGGEGEATATLLFHANQYPTTYE